MFFSFKHYTDVIFIRETFVETKSYAYMSSEKNLDIKYRILK